MNTYKKILSVPSSSTENMYHVSVSVLGNVVFNGKIFVMPYQTQVTFDLTNIFANYMFNGAGILKPTYTASTTQAYTQPTTAAVNLTNNFNTNKELIRLSYSIVITRIDTGASVTSSSDTVYLRSSVANSSRFSQNYTWRAFDSDKPISHYPTITSSSNLLRWGNTLSRTSSGTAYLYRKNGNNYSTLASWSNLSSGDCTVSTLARNLRNASGEYVYVQDNSIYKPIAYLDVCPAPYYLLWIDNDGAMACHKFTNMSEYSEAITVNTRVASDDTTFTANQFVEGKWKLKSYNLTDSEFEYYMSIINSPNIMLYDSEKQKCSYVRITDKSLTRKTMPTNKKKPVFMEINLQEITPKNYIA